MEVSTFNFLKNLEANNNREWFNDHKEDYLRARENLVSFVDQLISVIAEFDERIARVDAEKSLYRIYRDTRFSHDKSPYKNNFGANIGMGKGHQSAGYYLHIQPGGSFLAGGIYMPERNQLKEIRSEISYNRKEFETLMSNDSFQRNFGGLSEEGKLKRVPNGFEKDDAMGEYLKLKHFVAIRLVSSKEFKQKNAVQKFGKVFESVKPLNDFLNKIFD
ncbi:DUF2461 domain-containing protein [Chryseobacterium sp. Ch-15]|uniref:DUF2461 domain-containing protein n=1 Tax=Chryseobacterium muglaense TaxID=2893752 RepID=A0A9Q3UT90_9FLAO|nr:DUF2461 domain-containing protein [Chryseobacterium muglaense]MBD3906908.1 DUF2461 domain-containing protein [Chryseobacterium muglaense]MCC9033061.1 DUF2461 domain-containing protein [Chryseobacterium muglaense]MCM2556601.1 DUF2461 domain-containing protein [Chryseobacterium muglaense]